ncbi:hypothetical protein CXX93_05755 [Gordonia sp. YC-JH1]|nr:hypothetical protein CXX93_05755 [Gordonia sp. YC-JH1]
MSLGAGWLFPGLLSERSESKRCGVSMRVLAALAGLLDEPGGWVAFPRLVERAQRVETGDEPQTEEEQGAGALCSSSVCAGRAQPW